MNKGDRLGAVHLAGALVAKYLSYGHIGCWECIVALFSLSVLKRNASWNSPGAASLRY